MIRLLVGLACSLFLYVHAFALVGGASTGGESARHAVLITGGRGNFCTGTVIARDLVLTAAHCVPPGADYKLIEFDSRRQPNLRDMAACRAASAIRSRGRAAPTAPPPTWRCVKLAAPLPAALCARCGRHVARTVAVGDRFIVAGYGIADPRRRPQRRHARARHARRHRPARQSAAPAGRSATKRRAAGLGACTGDFGAPVLIPGGGRLAVIGVVSWSTGPGNSAGCGGLTGVTPLARYRDWIVETAGKMGSPLP